MLIKKKKDTNFFNRSIQNMYKNTNNTKSNIINDVQSVESSVVDDKINNKKENDNIFIDTVNRVPRQASAPPDLRTSNSDNESVTANPSKRVKKKSRTIIDGIESKKRKIADNGKIFI